MTNNTANDRKNIETGWKNTLYHGDCNTVLESLPNNIIDCVVTSPPYWGARNYNTDTQIGFEETMENYVNEIVTVFEKVKRVLQDDGSLFLSLGDIHQSTAPGTQNTASNLNEKTSQSQGTQYRFDSGLKAKSMMCLPERIITELVDNGWVLRNKITWVKKNPLPEPSAVDRFQQSWEPIYFLTSDSQYQFNEEENETADVWRIATANRKTIHPAPLPITICEKCITAACKKNGVVLDPFCGSGSTCIAAHKRNRDYVGIDTNEEYIKEAQKSLTGDAEPIQTETNSEDIFVDGQQRLSMY